MNERQIPFGEKLATLVVNGVEREVNASVYGEDAVLVLSDAFEVSPSDFTGRGREPYRAALVVRDGAIAENMSVRPALVGGSITDSGMEGVTVRSTTANFNHVIVENSEFSIRDCTLKADTASDGKYVCDFDGYGAVICAYKGAKVTIDGCDLYSRGVAKPIVFCDGGADVLLQNSSYRCMGGTLYAGYQNAAGFTKMVAPPWVLGITGSARGTNLMGELSTMVISNCDCKANDWGVVSTDGGNEMALYIIDSTLELLGEGNMLDNPFVRRYGPGYGVYACGCDEFILGTEFKVGTYAVIGIGGHVTLASSKGTITPKKKYLVPTGRKEPMPPDGHLAEVKDAFWHEEPNFAPITGKGRPTVVESDGWGFMFHNNTKLSVLDGTVVNTDYASILVRSVGMEIEIDNSELHPKDGVLLQMIDNDDKAVGGFFTPDIYDDEGNLLEPHMGPIFNHEFFEHPGFPGIDYQSVCQSSGETVHISMTNCTLAGSLYNATGYRNFGDGARGQGELLDVMLGDGCTLTGSITAATERHIDEKGRPKNIFTQEQYYYLGHVENRPFDNGVNPVSVVLTGNAVWKVTGRNLLSSLTLGENAAVVAAEGALTVTLDGRPLLPIPGNTYKGKLILEA